MVAGGRCGAPPPAGKGRTGRCCWTPGRGRRRRRGRGCAQGWPAACSSRSPCPAQSGKEKKKKGLIDWLVTFCCILS